MKMILLIIFILPILISNSISQVNEEWVARYNGTDNFNDAPTSIAVDGKGNVFVTGTSYCKNTFEDIVTIKYNSNGVMQWIRKFNSSDSSNDIAYSISIDKSDNILITGESMRRETGKDIITIKYNNAGEMLWCTTYNRNGTETGKNNDLGKVIATDEFNNVFVGGTSQDRNSDYDYIILKYDSKGTLMFEKRYTGPGSLADRIHDLKLDRAGNIYVTGESRVQEGGIDYLTIKYDSAGAQLWTARYNGPIGFGDIAKALCLDDFGNVFVTGTSAGFSLDDILTIKYNSSGIKIWEIRYNGSAGVLDHGNSIEADKSGNIYVAGGSTGKSNFLEFTTIKYNTAGYQEWISNYIPSTGGSGEATNVKVDGDNNIYVCGIINRAVSHLSIDDYALLRYDTAGNMKGIKFYDGPATKTDRPSAMQTGNYGNVYVTGKSNGEILNFDYATIKYSVLTKVNQISSVVPLSFKLEQNYPNPFNPVTKIRFTIPRMSSGNKFPVILKVYNIFGKEVSNIFDGELQSGEYEMEWDASLFASGLYFYEITFAKYKDSKKMMVIK